MEKKIERYIGVLELKIASMQRLLMKDNMGEIERMKAQKEIEVYESVCGDLKQMIK